MSGPFSGIRIIDLTSMVSGPLATMTLADQGADVIKVESPDGGDHARHVATRRGGYSASFLNNNRNKRSVVLDLKHRGGLDALMRLAAGAVIYRPGLRIGRRLCQHRDHAGQGLARPGESTRLPALAGR